MKVFRSIDELSSAVGTHLGYSDWHPVTQDRITAFAAATGDDSWIHVDEGRAAASPLGCTIAHGYLTVALIPWLTRQVYRVEGLAMALNYGTNMVRFPAPTPVNSRVRAGVEIISCEARQSGYRLASRVTIERKGADKPSCVAEPISLLVVSNSDQTSTRPVG